MNSVPARSKQSHVVRLINRRALTLTQVARWLYSRHPGGARPT